MWPLKGLVSIEFPRRHPTGPKAAWIFRGLIPGINPGPTHLPARNVKLSRVRSDEPGHSPAFRVRLGLASPSPRRIQCSQADSFTTNGDFQVSEQVHVRGLNCRGVRLERFAALGMALAMPALAAASTQATQTRLTAETRDQNGRTQASLSIAVAGEDGLPASGAVTIEDEGRPLAGAALNSDGTAKFTLGLLPGSHDLRAVYEGDAAHKASSSEAAAITTPAISAPDFSVAVNPATLSLTAGQTGNITASVIPVNAAALTAPMFVTLSCAGMPDQSSCTFTPENVEILPNATAATLSSLVITTQSTGSTHGLATPPARAGSNPVAWAVLLPGAFSLAGLAFAARRRRWLSRLTLVALVGLVSVMGATACSPRYDYFNHGPPHNLPTPTGTYTVTINAQSSNGVTATTRFTTLALTVK